MPKIRGSTTTKYKPPKWTKQSALDWLELMIILHDELFNHNWSATARALQVTIPTAKCWYAQEPKRTCELENLRAVVKSVIRFMQQSKHKGTRKKAIDALTKMRRFKLQTTLHDELIVEADEINSTSMHIISTIAWEPQRQIELSELLSAGRLQHVTRRQARRAVDELGLTKTQTGAGKDKKLWISIKHPND